MSASYAQQKAPWILGFLLLSQVLLMSFSARHPDSDQSVLRTWLIAIYTPFLKGGNWVISKASGAVSDYTSLKGARDENKSLREQVEQLTEGLALAREQAAQDSQIRSAYGVPAQSDYHKIAANVIARDASIWFRRLTIDRGTNDGVKMSMPVATAGGIVGRVVALGPNFAEVQLITDRHAGAGAMLQKSRDMGVVHGMDNGKCELREIPSGRDVQVGDVVESTGLDAIYPKGLVIGTIERVEDDPNAPWHRLIVQPGAPLDRLEYVMVLLVEQKDLKAQESVK
jgi:rod shape-determining protein MreC